MVTGGVYKLIIIRSFGRLFLGGFLNQPVNNWNVSNVEDMHLMFYNASSFNQPLNHWNVSNAIPAPRAGCPQSASPASFLSFATATA